MKPVAVTGVSGFIGSRVLEHFRRERVPVRGYTRGVTGSVQPGVLHCNYLDEVGLTKDFAGCGVVVHIAGLAHIGMRAGQVAAREYELANVHSALSVARAAKAAEIGRAHV